MQRVRKPPVLLCGLQPNQLCTVCTVLRKASAATHPDGATVRIPSSTVYTMRARAIIARTPNTGRESWTATLALAVGEVNVGDVLSPVLVGPWAVPDADMVPSWTGVRLLLT